MLPVCKVMRYSTAVQKCVTMEMHQPHNRYDDIKTTRLKKQIQWLAELPHLLTSKQVTDLC